MKYLRYLKMPPRGLGGVPKYCLPQFYFIFVTKNSVQNFITLGQPLLGEKNVAEKKEEKKKQAGAEMCQAQVKLG